MYYLLIDYIKNLFQNFPHFYFILTGNPRQRWIIDLFLIVCADFLEHKMGYFVEFAC